MECNLIHEKLSGTFESFQPKNETQGEACNKLQLMATNFTQRIKSNNGLLSLDQFALINIHGVRWGWKTHLLEAFINQFKNQWLASDDYLSLTQGAGFFEKHIAWGYITYSPIMVIDDIFAWKKADAFDESALEGLLTGLNKERRLILTSSEFAIKDVINLIIKRYEEKGGISSIINWMKEIRSRVTDIEIKTNNKPTPEDNGNRNKLKICLNFLSNYLKR